MTFWLVRTEGHPCASFTENFTKSRALALSYARNNDKPHKAPLCAILFAYSYKMGKKAQILQLFIMK